MTSHRVRTPDEAAMVPLWPDAAQLFGIHRSRAYYLAEPDKFPTPVIKVGARWRVPTVHLRRVLGLDLQPEQHVS